MTTFLNDFTNMQWLAELPAPSVWDGLDPFQEDGGPDLPPADCGHDCGVQCDIALRAERPGGYVNATVSEYHLKPSVIEHHKAALKLLRNGMSLAETARQLGTSVEALLSMLK